MPLLDNQNREFKTQLLENNVIDLTQNFYPGSPERQVLESNRERQDSNHERQKVKSTENKKKKQHENESISKHFIEQPVQYNRPKSQTPQNSEGIPLNKSFPLQTEKQELKLK